MMTLTRTRCQQSLIHLCNKSVSFSNSSSNRIADTTTTTTIVSSEEAKPTKKTKKKSISTSSPSSPPKLKAPPKQVRTIKNLHKENKALFGVLLESKQEKVKRTRQESKLMKTLTPSTVAENKRASKKKGLLSSAENESLAKAEDDEVDKTLDLILQEEKKRVKKLRSNVLPKTSSVRLEHAGVSINKNRIKRDVVQDNMMGKSSPLITTPQQHKEAEIEWAMRNAPTKIKLIELSPSSSTSDEVGGGTDQVGDTTQRQLVDEQGKKKN